MDIPVVLDDDKKQKLMKAALACPVHASLHPEIEKPVNFAGDRNSYISMGYSVFVDEDLMGCQFSAPFSCS